jgi:Holliday junction resolvasome RuvABC endonuclease subunit
MRVLSLDLGTRCGRAWTDDGEVHPEQSGTWDLESSTDKGHILPRYQRLYCWIEKINPDLIVYERVEMLHSSRKAAQLYGGYEATVRAYCQAQGIQCESFSVEQIKEFATGNKKETKPNMLWSAQDRWGDTVQDHNQADALHLLRLYLDGGVEHAKVRGGDDGGKEAA